MLRGLPIRSRLFLFQLAVVVPAVALVGILAYVGGKAAIARNTFDHLTAVRASKANQIQTYFRQLRHQAETFSENRMVVEAMREFAAAFRELDRAAVTPTERAAVRSYYADRFLPRLNAHAAEPVSVAAFFPDTPVTLHLQHRYITANPHPSGERGAVEAAEDTSRYVAAHGKYHRILRNFLQKFGYQDLLLIDTDGHIVYTVIKNPEFATSLRDGPYRTSSLAEAFRAARDAEDCSSVRLIDFAHYAPSCGAPASFMASPIDDGAERIGVLALQMPVGEINRVMTGGRGWRSEGLGETGETYLVGPDFRMRSASRFLLENPEGYLAALPEAAIPAADIGRIRAFGTSILLQEVRTAAARAALAGEADTAITADYRGISVLSSYAPLDLGDVKWAILAEIDTAEAFAPISAFTRWLLGGLAGMLALVLILSAFLARVFVAPIEALDAGAHRFAAGDRDVDLPVRGGDELGHLTETFNQMVAAIRARAEDLGESEARYRRLLQAVTTYTYTVHMEDGVPVSTDHSSGCLAATGYAPEDYAADPCLWISMVHPEDRRNVRQHVARVLAGEPVGPIEHRIVHRDGTTRWIRGTIIPHYGDGGQLSHYDGVVEDITERKRAELTTEASLRRQTVIGALLHESLEPISLTEYLERALDLLLSVPWIALESSGGILLVGDDPDVLVLTAQRGLPQALCDSCREVRIGQCMCGSAAANQEIVFADCIDERHTTQYTGIHPHGHYCVPMVADGELQGVINLYVKEGHAWAAEEEDFLAAVAGALASTVKRRRAEQLLQESEERFDLAVRGTHTAIWDWDLVTNRVYYSPGWKSMLGYEENGIADSYSEWDSRLHPDDREHALAAIQDCIEGRSATYEMEHRLRHKDGSYRWLLARGAGVFGSDGAVCRMVSSHIDITERKRMGAALRDREVGLLAARRVQQNLLPRAAPVVPGFDIAGAVYPADYAAGDLFDYLTMADGSLGIVVADVSGHGVPAALLATSARAYLRSLVEAHSDLAAILRIANGILAHEIEDDRFVTLLLGRVDPATSSFAYASAGHTTGYVLDPAGDVKARLASTSGALGVLPEAVFASGDQVELRPGDILLLLTDGVIEATSPKGACFGTGRTLDTVRANRDRPASEIVQSFHQAIRDFSESDSLVDDITVVVVKAE